MHQPTHHISLFATCHYMSILWFLLITVKLPIKGVGPGGGRAWGHTVVARVRTIM